MFNVEKSLKGLIVLSAMTLILSFSTAWFYRSLALKFQIESPIQLHLALATVSVLMSMFSDTCILFYFIGTSVWIRDRSKEVFLQNRAAGKIVMQLHEKANKLKARSFPFATLGIGLGLFTFVLGGANQVHAIPKWLHPLLASLLLLNALYAMKHYFFAIGENIKILDQVSDSIEAQISKV